MTIRNWGPVRDCMATEVTEVDGRATADLHLPRQDEASLGQLFQMLMLATVVEGRLVGINPYGQPGVEAYKRNMNAILREGETL